MFTPKNFQIASRTNRITAEVRLEVVSSSRRTSSETAAERAAYNRVHTVLYAIKWARETGRLHVSAEMMLREISGYQFASLVLRIASYEALSTIEDIKNYLRGDVSSLNEVTCSSL